jgi:hypothetical protein
MHFKTDSERNKSNNKIVRIKTAFIDGIKMKADVWYKLSRGKFVVVKNNKNQ